MAGSGAQTGVDLPVGAAGNVTCSIFDSCNRTFHKFYRLIVPIKTMLQQPGIRLYRAAGCMRSKPLCFLRCFSGAESASCARRTCGRSYRNWSFVALFLARQGYAQNSTEQKQPDTDNSGHRWKQAYCGMSMPANKKFHPVQISRFNAWAIVPMAHQRT